MLTLTERAGDVNKAVCEQYLRARVGQEGGERQDGECEDDDDGCVSVEEVLGSVVWRYLHSRSAQQPPGVERLRTCRHPTL